VLYNFSKFTSFFDNPWGDDDHKPKKKKVVPKANTNNVSDIEHLIDKYKGNFDNFNKNFSGKSIILILPAIILLWLFTGFYTVQPDEQALILRFGKYDRTAGPGLHYHLPAPVEKLLKVQVTKINSVAVGYVSMGSSISAKTEESLMLTGDENIVDINFEVQWKVKDAYKYLFNVRDNLVQTSTVKTAAESAMRAVIGKTDIAVALAEGRSSIELESKELLQEILDDYNFGVEVVRLQLLKVDPPAQVIDAFKDVQTAKLEKEKIINQAESYRNDIIPKARGEAQKIIEEAKAYKSEIVEEAKGRSQRFLELYREYSKSRDITRKRIYIDTMKEVFSKANVTIMDGKSTNTGVMPYMPINKPVRNGGN
jgi:membrane protease subunit HflK